MLSLPKNDDCDSQLTDVAALRPLKLLRYVFWFNLMLKALDCVEPTLGPADAVDPMEKLVADIAAISQTQPAQICLTFSFSGQEIE